MPLAPSCPCDLMGSCCHLGCGRVSASDARKAELNSAEPLCKPGVRGLKGEDLFFFLPEDHESEVCSGKGCDSTPPKAGPEPKLTDCTILTQNPHAGLSHLLFILIVEFAECPGDDDRAGDA